MADHTSGPWAAHEKGIHPHPYVCGAVREYEHGPDAPVVAYLVGGDTQANASLISTAPDLLEALKAAMAFIDSHAADPDLTSEMVARYSEMQALDPHAVIAKAEGQKT